MEHACGGEGFEPCRKAALESAQKRPARAGFFLLRQTVTCTLSRQGLMYVKSGRRHSFNIFKTLGIRCRCNVNRSGAEPREACHRGYAVETFKKSVAAILKQLLRQKD
jgi:hypothetical protein